MGKGQITCHFTIKPLDNPLSTLTGLKDNLGLDYGSCLDYPARLDAPTYGSNGGFNIGSCCAVGKVLGSNNVRASDATNGQTPKRGWRRESIGWLLLPLLLLAPRPCTATGSLRSAGRGISISICVLQLLLAPFNCCSDLFGLFATGSSYA